MAPDVFESAYIQTHAEGRLEKKIEKAFEILRACSLCPRRCGIDRTEDERSFCRSGLRPMVSSYAPHFGEEAPLVGSHGSGTIFFTHCNLGCSFCQNYSISHRGDGREIGLDRLSQMMIELQSLGCHNINFVSPTHFVPQILKALPRSIEMGLSVPLVYNTGGYDQTETLKILDGVVDIYMPDYKFVRSDVAQKYARAEDYPRVVREALKEMHRQVGDLSMDERGVARRGLLVRHLVLPEGLAGTEDAMEFLAREISPDTYVNIMAQYYPCGDIPPRSPMARRITPFEFERAVRAAKNAGLHRLD
jgi:putative pyruvate formate lyase activating enzyme